jgi:SAM-dependent methyltransferase
MPFTKLYKMEKNGEIKDYWEKRLNDNFGLHGTGFIGLGKKYNSWMYKVRKHVFLKKLSRLNICYGDINVLDIGSGSGFYIGIWNGLGVKKITGCDLTAVAVRNLKASFPNNTFYELDISEDVIPIPEKFDIITAFDMLFHIVDDNKYSKAIENIYSLLKPGGLFIFSENFMHKNPNNNKYQTSRSLNDLEQIIKGCGFSILNRSPMFFFMNAPVDSDSVFFKKSWRLITKAVQRGESLGSLLGFILFPIEILMTSLKKEGPSTEIMICKKP